MFRLADRKRMWAEFASRGRAHTIALYVVAFLIGAAVALVIDRFLATCGFWHFDMSSWKTDMLCTLFTGYIFGELDWSDRKRKAQLSEPNTDATMI